MNYDNMVTRIALWASVSSTLIDYVYNRILYNMEDEDAKETIIGLCNEAYKLGRKIDSILFRASINGFAGPGDLERLYVLTDDYWDALLELYSGIGQDEYDQQKMYLDECMINPDYRETAEELLEPFYPQENGTLRG